MYKTPKITYKVVLKYGAFLILMQLLCYARTASGIAPFGLGFFVGLLYSKQNFFACAIFYTLSMLVSAPSLTTLVVAIIPPIILGAAISLHTFTKRQIKMWQINIYALISQLPLLIFGMSEISLLISNIATIILSQVFTYTTATFLHAALVRGIKYRFRPDEIIAALALLTGLGMGLFRINIFGFQPFYLVASVAIILSAAITRTPVPSICASIMLGLGGGIMTGNLMMLGGLVLSAGVANVFIKNNYYLGIAAYALLELFSGIYFHAFGNYGYLHFIALAVGVIICLCCPNSLRDRLRNLYCGYSDHLSSNEVTERNRKEINQKLIYVSNVFSEMSDLLLGETRKPIASESASAKLAQEITVNFCSHCPNSNACMSALGGDISLAIIDMVSIAESFGEATIDHINAFLSSRCNRIVGLIGCINRTVAQYKQKNTLDSEINQGKLMLGEQMQGISEMLQEFASELKKPISYDGEREKLIIDDLAAEDILCTDILVSSIACGYSLTLLLRKGDIDDPKLLRIINKIIGFPMEIKSVVPSRTQGFVYMRLEDLPRFGVCYAVSNQALDDNKASGDSYSITQITNNKLMLALCDGMGTGILAHYNSSTTISMIESFYKAGFNNNSILSMLNKLLSTYNTDTFTCLDMVIIDQHSGICDFIKLGAVTSIIKRNNEFLAIDGNALPLGIVEEAEPYVERKILLSGDLLTMFSDGVIDTLGEDGIKCILSELGNSNPQVMADTILNTALRSGAKDDATVIVSKIFLKDSPQNVAK